MENSIASMKEVLDRHNYLKFKRANDIAYALMPMLYYTDEYIYVFNNNGLAVEDDSEIVMVISEESFEYVVKGTIENKKDVLNVKVSEVNQFPNRRNARRYDVNIATTVSFAGVTYNATIVNMSKSGCLLSIDEAIDVKPESNATIKVQMADLQLAADVVRTEIRMNRELYGVRFHEECDILGILKTFKLHLLFEEGVNLFVIFDSKDDLQHFQKLLHNHVILNFININCNFDSFIVDFMEEKKKGLILLDIKDEKAAMELVDKIGNYLYPEKNMMVLVEEDASDDFIGFLIEKKPNIIFKPFLETELKKIVLKMT